MKLVLILFAFLSSLIPTWMTTEDELPENVQALKDEFEAVAQDSYDAYYVYVREAKDDYVYEVIIGKYKNNLYYDIFLYNITTNYAPRIEIDGIEYEIEKIEKNDEVYYSTNSITNPGNSEISVYLFNGISKSSEVIIPSDYSQYNSSIGLGNGVIVNFPEPIQTADKNFVYILSISICIIFVCLVGIGVFYIMKIGKKTATPMGYQKNLPHVNFNEGESYYQAMKNQNVEFKVSVDNELKDSNIETVSIVNEDKQETESNITESTESVYDKSPKYSDDEDTNSKEVDIASLLMMKGYNTDYSLMTEQEKNDVMVYLMLLRKTEQISYDQYSKEVIKLWKK